jgi:site-specific DNA-cytosine methylase
VQKDNLVVSAILMDNLGGNIKQRVQENGDAWTLGGSKTGILQEQRIRRLTPTECERLQGFPDGWTQGVSDTQRYKCLGNAVTVPVIQFLGERILASVGGKPIESVTK